MSNPAPPIENLTRANDRRRKTAARLTCQEVAAALGAGRVHRRWVSIAKLRITFPQASLAELAAAHRPPLTKDAYAARLRRLLIAAKAEKS